MKSVRLEVRMYAVAAELSGNKTVHVDVDKPHRVSDLRSALAAQFPDLAAILARLMFAVNSEYADDEFVIPPGSEVACIPPVSGGTLDRENPMCVSITESSIDYHALTESVRSTRAGAVVTFLGTAREFTGDRQTESLEYEAYEKMAVAKLHDVAAQAQAQWPILAYGIEHRVGPIELGEIAVAIAVSSPHRNEAFAACQYMMDTIKQVVPIWKKEVWCDGTSEWIHPGLEDRSGVDRSPDRQIVEESTE